MSGPHFHALQPQEPNKFNLIPLLGGLIIGRSNMCLGNQPNGGIKDFFKIIGYLIFQKKIDTMRYYVISHRMAVIKMTIIRISVVGM